MIAQVKGFSRFNPQKNLCHSITVEGDIEWVSNDLSAGIISTLFYVYFSITSYLSR